MIARKTVELNGGICSQPGLMTGHYRSITVVELNLEETSQVAVFVDSQTFFGYATNKWTAKQLEQLIVKSSNWG